MNSEEKILAILEQHSAKFDKIDALLEQHSAKFDKIDALLEKHGEMLQELKEGQTRLETRLGAVEQKVSDMDEVLTRTALRQENEVIPKLQLLYENQVLLIDTTAKKEDVDALREELSLEKFRIDTVAERLPK